MIENVKSVPRRSQDIAAEIADALIEFGIDNGKAFVGEALADLLGLLKTLGKASWKMGRTVQDRRREARDPVGHTEEHVQSVVDGLIEDMARIGDAETARGGREAALDAYRAGLAIAERLAARDPGNAQWQRDLIVSHVKMAEAGGDPRARYAAAVARGLEESGRLAPVDGWMVEALERRLAEAGAG